MRIRPLPLLLLLLTALPVFADDVYLVNGRKFEGVMTETTDSQVRIQMQGGVIVLPRSQVLRVEAGDSNLAEFLHRKEALKKNPGTRAADWLEPVPHRGVDLVHEHQGVVARRARTEGIDGR